MRELKKYDTFQELADWYDYKYIDMGDGWECPENVALEYLAFMGITEPNKSKLLLDVGCGAGHFIQTATKYVDCEGIDISKVGIVKARERLPEVSFYVDNIETLEDFILYDYITSIGSVEHTLDIPKALRNMNKLLTVEGLAFILVPNEDWVHMDQPNEVTHTDKEWSAMFKRAGFAINKFQKRGDLSLFLLEK